MIIAIDFDGTIVEHKYPRIGVLLPDAKEIINRLYNEGHFIIIWTCRYERDGLQEMIEFLKEVDIKFNAVNENAPRIKISFNPYPKIFAHCYIDDRNLGGFPGWKAAYNLVQKMQEDF